MAKGLRSFVDGEAFDRFVERVAFARTHAPNLGYPAFDDAGLRVAMLQIAEVTGFATSPICATRGSSSSCARA
jgi:hypothetical protein